VVICVCPAPGAFLTYQYGDSFSSLIDEFLFTPPTAVQGQRVHINKDWQMYSTENRNSGTIIRSLIPDKSE
jgi:hypothetical protein